jgi:hypothetical protein
MDQHSLQPNLWDICPQHRQNRYFGEWNEVQAAKVLSFGNKTSDIP